MVGGLAGQSPTGPLSGSKSTTENTASIAKNTIKVYLGYFDQESDPCNASQLIFVKTQKRILQSKTLVFNNVSNVSAGMAIRSFTFLATNFQVHLPMRKQGCKSQISCDAG